MPVKFTLQPQTKTQFSVQTSPTNCRRLPQSTQEEMFVVRIQNGSGDPFCLHEALVGAQPLPCCHLRCHRHSVVLWHRTFSSCLLQSAQGPQHGSTSAESLHHGTLLVTYRLFSSISKCQSSLTATTELRKYQQGQYFNGNSLVYKSFQNPSSL